mmetsp:Transcript_3556/g.12273  ORF Transcript_3556/g.12273 Transcript_3556/m.12273 type:complete len:240 (-) Transcript_3556:6-725(-)
MDTPKMVARYVQEAGSSRRASSSATMRCATPPPTTTLKRLMATAAMPLYVPRCTDAPALFPMRSPWGCWSASKSPPLMDSSAARLPPLGPLRWREGASPLASRAFWGFPGGDLRPSDSSDGGPPSSKKAEAVRAASRRSFLSASQSSSSRHSRSWRTMRTAMWSFVTSLTPSKVALMACELGKSSRVRSSYCRNLGPRARRRAPRGVVTHSSRCPGREAMDAPSPAAPQMAAMATVRGP